MRRLLVAVALALATTASPAFARDTATAKKDLARASDFRVRVSAALYLGRSKEESARPALESALHDAHPSVRAAAAAGLAANGDASSIPALEQVVTSESIPDVKAQFRASISSLQSTSSSSPKYMVQVGAMRNNTVTPVADAAGTMKTMTQNAANSLPGAVVVSDKAVLKAAGQDKVPLIVLDGAIVQLGAVQGSGGARSYTAKVDFTVRRMPENALKASVSGSATSMASKDFSARGQQALREQAIAGAIESALRQVGPGLAQATNP